MNHTSIENTLQDLFKNTSFLNKCLLPSQPGLPESADISVASLSLSPSSLSPPLLFLYLNTVSVHSFPQSSTRTTCLCSSHLTEAITYHLCHLSAHVCSFCISLVSVLLDPTHHACLCNFSTAAAVPVSLDASLLALPWLFFSYLDSLPITYMLLSLVRSLFGSWVYSPWFWQNSYYCLLNIYLYGLHLLWTLYPCIQLLSQHILISNVILTKQCTLINHQLTLCSSQLSVFTFAVRLPWT